MASERVKMILRSRGAPFSDEEIDSMQDKDGWNWIYSNRPAPKPHVDEICFTGFRKPEREKLEQKARTMGFNISKSVTKKLDYLCIGETAGPSKLKKAKEQGAQIITQEEFTNFKNDDI